MSRWEPNAEGRLMQAAIELFRSHGYEATTVAEIASAAGLTKRTFFRYFTDKREVLFTGAQELQERWIRGIAAAPPAAEPMSAVSVGLDEVVAMFVELHPFARTRAEIVAANAELQERELIKLQTLTAAIGSALVDRGVPDNAATLAAYSGVTVFHVAFARWVQQDDPAAFRRLIDEALDDLRSVTAVPA